MNLTENRNRLLRLFAILPFKRQIIGLLNAVNRRRLAAVRTPENLIYFVTNRCNARCRHCFYWSRLNDSADELTLAQLQSVVSSLKNRIETLLITGGEPLLRPDLYEIIDLFYRINHMRKAHLTTNGSFPDKLFALCEAILARMNLELSVQVSVDGDEAYHNALRGGDFYQKAIESLRRLKPLGADQSNFILTASTTVTTANVHCIDAVARQMQVMGIPWGFNLLRTSTYGILGLHQNDIAQYDPKDNSMSLPPVETIRRLMDEHIPPSVDLRLMLQRATLEYSLALLGRRRPALKCRAGVVDGVLYPDGDVALCEVTKPFDNLRDYQYDFYKLWTSPKAREARTRVQQCSCMHGCHMINAMKYDYGFLLETFKR